jgi:hypothetical protein
MKVLYLKDNMEKKKKRKEKRGGSGIFFRNLKW